MPADPDRIATAQAMLAELGVTLADLQRAQRPRVPTLAEYLPQVIAAAGPGTRTYAAYWQRMATCLGRPPVGHHHRQRCRGTATPGRGDREIATQ